MNGKTKGIGAAPDLCGRVLAVDAARKLLDVMR